MIDTAIVMGSLLRRPIDPSGWTSRPVDLLINMQLNQVANPQGFPRVYNALLAQAFSGNDRRYVWVMGDDVFPEPGCLDATQEFMQANDDIGIIFPVEYWKQGDERVTAIPPHGTIATLEEARRLGLETPTMDQIFAGFACACIREEVWNDLGPMDESFGLGYCEDLDYGLRAWKAGWRVVNYRQAFFFHERGRTFNHLVKSGVIPGSMPYEAARLAKEKWPFLWPEDGRGSEQIYYDTMKILKTWYAEAGQ